MLVAREGVTMTINWQGAVGVLEAERGRATSAAALIRRAGTPQEKTRAELIYGEGMAEANAMIGTLIVAVGQGGVDDMDGVEKRLARATDARERLGQLARAIADREPGQKAVGPEWLVKLGADLLKAVVGALWSHRAERDAVTRKDITTRLETARWPAFAEIETG